MPRKINLSGNTVDFSMLENFSRDFPGDNLVENLNIFENEKLKYNKSVELIRRWWNFYDKSFF